MSEITVLLADDHGLIRRGLRQVLEEQPDIRVVGEAANGREAVQICEQLRPSVVVVDIAMPQLNGIDAVVRILKASPETQALLLSVHSDESYILRGLLAGAKGYLLKDNGEDFIVAAVRAVAAGKSFFSPTIASLLMEDYVRSLRQRGIQDSYELLTDREREVLQLLAQGQSNKEVANTLGVGVSTVETHRMNLMQKLNLHSTAEIVLYAVRKRLIPDQG